MPLPLMTISGTVMRKPRWKPTPGGLPVIHLRLLAVERRRDSDGDYHDGEQFEVEARAYKDLAENIRDSIEAGDLIVSTGRIQTETYFDALGKPKSQNVFILADLGPSLKDKPRRHEHVIRAELQAQTDEHR